MCVCMRGSPRPETLEVGLGRRKLSLLFVPVKGEYMLGELVVLVAVSVAILGDDSDVDNDTDDDGSDDVGGGGGVIALFIVAGLCVVICCDHDAHSCRVAAVNDSYGAATDFCVSPVLVTVLETCPKRTRWLSGVRVLSQNLPRPR